MSKLVPAAACLFATVLAVGAAAPSKARVHGFPLSGTIARLDEVHKTLVVRGASGKETTLSWTDATSVFGGKLAAGQSVTLRYLDREGKHIATSIRISPPAVSRPAATPAPTPSPAA